MSGAPNSLKAPVVAALAAAAALAAVSPAAAARPAAPPGGKPAKTQTNPSNGAPGHGAQVDQGLVQSVTENAVLLKALDGSTFSVPVGRQTRVLVDGRLALLRDVKPGFVALVKWVGGKAAQQLAAFDLSAKSGKRLATVEAVGKTSVAVTAASGGTTTIHVNVQTRVFVDGKLSALRDVEPGYTLVTTASTPKGGKPASELLFLTAS